MQINAFLLILLVPFSILFRILGRRTPVTLKEMSDNTVRKDPTSDGDIPVANIEQIMIGILMSCLILEK